MGEVPLSGGQAPPRLLAPSSGSRASVLPGGRGSSSLVSVKLALAVALTLVLAVGTAARGAEYYVTSHGWHTGIAVPRAAVLAAGAAWPPGVAAHDFAGCAWLELGWGDRKFYMAKKPGVAMAVGAALVPGRSVLHVVGLPASPGRERARWTALVPIPCTDVELRDVCRALGASFERDAAGRAPRLGPGLYGVRSGFYAARGRYWIGDTCNSWTLRTARAGGLALRVGPRGTLQAGAVIAQVRREVARRKVPTGEHGRRKHVQSSGEAVASGRSHW